MVKLTYVLLKAKRQRSFLDKIRVYVKGGAGGNGLPKFGGKGGKGGDVCVTAKNRATLKQVVQSNPEKRFIAGRGANSSVRALLGENGQDINIDVPLGVVVCNDAKEVLGELNEEGDNLIVASGGKGGHSRNDFLGEKGRSLSITLDLKLIADIGLVGFPNAGKSTLLSAISRAAPKIAAYPFTTIQPQLGTLMYDDLRQITMADLPGLIEGAHMNVGMGHSFLKHVERTKLLLFMVDIHGFRLGAKYPMRSAFETIVLLMKELELYNVELRNKPAVLALNKIDMEDSDDRLTEIMEQLNDIEGTLSQMDERLRPGSILKFDDIIPISARNRDKTDHLKTRLRELLDLYADMERNSEKEQLLREKRIRQENREHFQGKRFV